MNTILIDGFNLIYKFPDLELCMARDDLNRAKEGLVQILAQYQRIHSAERILLFLDGKKNKGDETLQEERQGLQIYYSIDREADELLIACIRESRIPSQLTLVTSDKKIRQFARRLKVKLIQSEDFAVEILHAFDGEGSLPDDFLEKLGPDSQKIDRNPQSNKLSPLIQDAV